MNIISRSEIDRIKASLENPIEDTIRMDKRAHLKKLSADRVKNWPNTLEATRRKKEMFVKDKHAREESDRQEIDRQEAEHRKLERFQAIERANELLYAQRDKMKLLKSQLLYSDILADREKQVIENKQRKGISKVLAQQEHENIMTTVKQLEEIENEKIRKAEQTVKDVAKTRQEQLLEVKARKEAEAEENRQIGLAIKLQAQQRLDEEYKAQQEKWILVKQRNMEFKQANEELKKIRTEMKMKEKLAEDERAAELDAIENRKIALKELEKKRFDRAQVTRQMLIDRAVENLKNTINADEAKLKKQIDEKNIKDENIRMEKEARHHDDLKRLKEAREEQIRRRDELWQKEREEEAKMIEIWRKEYYEHITEQDRKEKEAFQLNRNLKANQYAEGQTRRRQRTENKLKEIAEEKFLFEMNSHDDDKFVQLCKVKLEEYRKAGKPTYPIQRALETTELEILPARTVSLNLEKVKTKQ